MSVPKPVAVMLARLLTGTLSLSLSLSLAACGGTTSESTANGGNAAVTPASFEGLETLDFLVSGMTCEEGCAPLVKRVLVEAGIAEGDVLVDFEARRCQVRVRPGQPDPAVLVSAFEGTIYRLLLAD